MVKNKSQVAKKQRRKLSAEFKARVALAALREDKMLEAHHAVVIIEAAFARFGTPEIVNTDQGSQFTAEEFNQAVFKRGATSLLDQSECP